MSGLVRQVTAKTCANHGPNTNRSCHLSMPPAIISPSVLASDFGQLTAECKRMIIGGAQWLHMGKLQPFRWRSLSYQTIDVMDGWLPPPFLRHHSSSNSRTFTAISFPILPWVCIYWLLPFFCTTLTQRIQAPPSFHVCIRVSQGYSWTAIWWYPSLRRLSRTILSSLPSF